MAISAPLARIPHLVLLALMLLQLAGCASYYASRPEVAERIDRWLAEDRYGLVLDTIAAMKPDHPQYRMLHRRLPAIRQQAQAYARRMAREALALARQRKWQQALERYDEALAHYPQSRYLQQERARFLADREAWLGRLDRKWLQQQGEWLLKALPLQREIVATNPRDRAQQERLKELQALRHETAQGLTRHGLKAMEQQNFVLASRLLGLANELEPTPRTRIALSRIQTRSARAASHRDAEARHRLQQLRQQQFRQYLGYFDEAFSRQDWLEARAYLEELRRLAPDSAELKKRARQLKERIDAHVARETERGERQYSQGEFEQALKTWQAVQPLAPDNRRLAENIARARRVIANLRALGQRPPLLRFPVEGESE